MATALLEALRARPPPDDYDLQRRLKLFAVGNLVGTLVSHSREVRSHVLSLKTQLAPLGPLVFSDDDDVKIAAAFIIDRLCKKNTPWNLFWPQAKMKAQNIQGVTLRDGQTWIQRVKAFVEAIRDAEKMPEGFQSRPVDAIELNNKDFMKAIDYDIFLAIHRDVTLIILAPGGLELLDIPFSKISSCQSKEARLQPLAGSASADTAGISQKSVRIPQLVLNMAEEGNWNYRLNAVGRTAETVTLSLRSMDAVTDAMDEIVKRGDLLNRPKVSNSQPLDVSCSSSRNSMAPASSDQLGVAASSRSKPDARLTRSQAGKLKSLAQGTSSTLKSPQPVGSLNRFEDLEVGEPEVSSKSKLGPLRTGASGSSLAGQGKLVKRKVQASSLTTTKKSKLCHPLKSPNPASQRPSGLRSGAPPHNDASDIWDVPNESASEHEEPSKAKKRGMDHRTAKDKPQNPVQSSKGGGKGAGKSKGKRSGKSGGKSSGKVDMKGDVESSGKNSAKKSKTAAPLTTSVEQKQVIGPQPQATQAKPHSSLPKEPEIESPEPEENELVQIEDSFPLDEPVRTGSIAAGADFFSGSATVALELEAQPPMISESIDGPPVLALQPSKDGNSVANCPSGLGASGGCQNDAIHIESSSEESEDEVESQHIEETPRRPSHHPSKAPERGSSVARCQSPLVDVQSARKPALVSFGPQGPRNQAAAPPRPKFWPDKAVSKRQLALADSSSCLSTPAQLKAVLPEKRKVDEGYATQSKRRMLQEPADEDATASPFVSIDAAQPSALQRSFSVNEQGSPIPNDALIGIPPRSSSPDLINTVGAPSEPEVMEEAPSASPIQNRRRSATPPKTDFQPGLDIIEPLVSRGKGQRRSNTLLNTDPGPNLGVKQVSSVETTTPQAGKTKPAISLMEVQNDVMKVPEQRVHFREGTIPVQGGTTEVEVDTVQLKPAEKPSIVTPRRPLVAPQRLFNAHIELDRLRNTREEGKDREELGKKKDPDAERRKRKAFDTDRHCDQTPSAKSKFRKTSLDRIDAFSLVQPPTVPKLQVRTKQPIAPTDAASHEEAVENRGEEEKAPSLLQTLMSRIADAKPEATNETGSESLMAGDRVLTPAEEWIHVTSGSDSASDSADETEPEENEADEMVWKYVVAPRHQGFHDVMMHLTRRALTHLADSETAVNDIVDDYCHDGLRLVEDMEVMHDEKSQDVDTKLSTSASLLAAKFRASTKKLQSIEQAVTGESVTEHFEASQNLVKDQIAALKSLRSTR
ncbi:hypothetical protein EJ06DRAFT_29913 [Trichodelitschia bisporula]|uniref:Uncharacterized protein n=1 Tax=Trichodelitschia bisporula TaxID=703511 RepID=A0A6G1IB68_9PEZI|nr:hypothetical protein EJ06DRAFT_29913 [Trichodelitschia bisporula]